MPFWFLGLGQLLLLASLAAAFLLWHWWPLVLFGVAIAYWVVWLATSAPLVPISAAEAKRSKRIGNVVVVGVLIASAAVLLVSKYAV